LVDGLGRFVFQGTPRERYCKHLDQVSTAEPPEPVCPKCVDGHYKWVHVRMCLTCGELGCCDSSSAQHARQHFEETGHPMIRSVEPGEQWGWCYVDKAYLRGTDFLA
jgi:CPA2 family monovalent cation:H+ antiporter-2